MNTQKTLYLAVAVAIFLVSMGGIIDGIVRHRLIEPHFITLEQQQGRDDVFRAVQALEREVYHLGVLARDWAEWDDTYAYVYDRNPEYEKANYQMPSLLESGINLLYVVDERGMVVNGKIYDSQQEHEIVLPEFPTGQLVPGTFLYSQLQNKEENNGLVLTGHGPLLIAVHPIQNSVGTGPTRGMLVMGRFLKEEIIRDLCDQTRVEFTLTPLADVDWPGIPFGRAEFLPGTVLLGVHENTQRLDGYTMISDLTGSPTLFLQARLSREISEHGARAARLVSIVIVLFTGGVVALLSGVVLFVHYVGKRERQRIEELVAQRTKELAISSKRLTVMAEAAFEGVVLLQDGSCLMMNRRAEEMFGYCNDEIAGKSTLLLIHPADRERTRKNVEGNYDLPYEVRGQRKSGEVFPLEIYGKSIEYEGKFVRAAVLRDLTDQKNRDAEWAVLEDRLKRSQKMETIGLMAGGVAHDLNNILSGLVTYPELLMIGLPQDNPLYGPLKSIHGAGKRAADVVADLLTVARGVAMSIHPENLNRIVREYLQSPEHERLQKALPEVTFSVELSEQLPNTFGSTAHINKSLMNLVMNGAEAIHGVGQVIIGTHISCVDHETAAEYGVRAGEYVVLTVSDSGTGISEGDLDHIFEPFYTRKVVGRSGTGLGLAVVWNTMQDHKGAVRVRSDENGSRFMLYFPATERQLETCLDEDFSSLKGSGERVMIVDDNPEQLAIASSILKALNYLPVTVNSGEQAVSLLQSQTPELVILDMLMEPGMNGYETYVQIIKHNPHQKALIASGYSESDDVRKTLELGAGQFIQKPYSVGQMGRAVQSVLQGIQP